MRILGLDIGTRRVGVAVSDALKKTARPLTVISPRDLEGEPLGRIVRDYEVEEIVVGMPTTLRGERGDAARMAREAMDRLRASFRVPVVEYDERLTTSMAEAAMAEAGVSAKERRGKVDMVAAALMLQGYLDRKASKAG
ncbi:MAG: Holliday junction resolvase RuvX [Actinobacteria bacterium]|nr:MAG: Holliday junction resolvase RuvX [Actinomycetota bacterium]